MADEQFPVAEKNVRFETAETVLHGVEQRSFVSIVVVGMRLSKRDDRWGRLLFFRAGRGRPRKNEDKQREFA